MKTQIVKMLLLALLSVMTFSCKKDKTEEASTIKWTKYTTADGLMNDNIHAIAIDASGNIWAGTDAGISKFDGTKWTNYERSNYRPVLAIAIDSQGNKWIGTNGGGASKFDGSGWIDYKYEANSSNCIASDYISSIAIDSQGNKWFGIIGGVAKFDGVNWVTFNTGNGLEETD